jgi:hypothetical protein
MLFQITSRGDEGIACIQLLLIINISIHHRNSTHPLNFNRRSSTFAAMALVDGSQTCAGYNVFYGSGVYWYTIQ